MLLVCKPHPLQATGEGCCWMQATPSPSHMGRLLLGCRPHPLQATGEGCCWDASHTLSKPQGKAVAGMQATPSPSHRGRLLLGCRPHPLQATGEGCCWDAGHTLSKPQGKAVAGMQAPMKTGQPVHPPHSSVFVAEFNPEYGNTDLLIWLLKRSSHKFILFGNFLCWEYGAICWKYVY